MTVGSGLGASLGLAAESTYGTYVAPTRWWEFESESLEWKPTRTVGKGLYAGGLVSRSSQRQTTTATVDGDIVTPVYTKGMGLLLGGIFGSLGLTPAQQASTAAYLQTHSLAPSSGQSLTAQVGRPTMDGTIHQYNYTGLKVTKAVFEAKVNEPLRVTVTFDGKDYQETSTYVAPTYQSPNPPFFWNQGVFQMGALGSEAAVTGVRSWTLSLERKLKVDNFYLDGTGRKSQPVGNDFVVISGDIETDFQSKAAFADIFAADTAQSMIVSFTGGLIASSYSYNVTFKVPQMRFDSEPPKVGGPDIIMPKMAYVGLFDDTNVAVSATYQTTDTTQ